MSGLATITCRTHMTSAVGMSNTKFFFLLSLIHLFPPCPSLEPLTPGWVGCYYANLVWEWIRSAVRKQPLTVPQLPPQCQCGRLFVTVTQLRAAWPFQNPLIPASQLLGLKHPLQRPATEARYRDRIQKKSSSQVIFLFSYHDKRQRRLGENGSVKHGKRREFPHSDFIPYSSSQKTIDFELAARIDLICVLFSASRNA